MRLETPFFQLKIIPKIYIYMYSLLFLEWELEFQGSMPFYDCRALSIYVAPIWLLFIKGFTAIDPHSKKSVYMKYIHDK